MKQVVDANQMPIRGLYRDDMGQIQNRDIDALNRMKITQKILSEKDARLALLESQMAQIQAMLTHK